MAAFEQSMKFICFIIYLLFIYNLHILLKNKFHWFLITKCPHTLNHVLSAFSTILYTFLLNRATETLFKSKRKNKKYFLHSLKIITWSSLLYYYFSVRVQKLFFLFHGESSTMWNILGLGFIIKSYQRIIFYHRVWT